MEVLRFDFNGSSSEFKRTPQGFLRINAYLTKTGIFQYENGREYRSDDEVFRADSLESLKGAPVTDLHPSEKGVDSFLTPANAKQHIIGIAEGVEREGPYLKGSIIIFHEDAIKAIEKGERKEISLGYKCRLEQVPGSINGEAYDAIQRDIIVNHIAIGPKGWGRAGPDCAIRIDSTLSKGADVTDTIRVDGVDIVLSKESITTLLSEKKRELHEARGRLDAMGLELEKEKAARALLEDPSILEKRVQTRLALIEKCRSLLGVETNLDGKSDEELKLDVIAKFYPEQNIPKDDASYVEGMFNAICGMQATRNDSLAAARKTINSPISVNSVYEKWLEQSAKLWSIPLAGSVR
ncbi:DUF2213 domain-containing protein [Candidatus Dojkabacteria bacterium]|uniref:DUF2213 domain-containing protein n=1 Tax=Candidatus Dojkabacteria bacterium TaxID=2099670 RepID=A0A5C7J381_9BACT|nr:MAG: DUF2213 domain-containing protein [Candidatus Dojkabacteria bacterium]